MNLEFDPLVPRPVDLPTPVPLDGDLTDEIVDLLDGAKIFAAPDDPALWPAWRNRLARWRDRSRDRLGFDASAYNQPAAAWAATCHAIAQVWLWDELLYDAKEGQFTPGRFLEDAQRRFGGLDAVVLWHAYPVIGVDDRNQWDWYRDIPGLRALVDDFHDVGVKVCIDYNPWDVGTRRSGDDITELTSLIQELDADGVFLDTLREAGNGLVDALQLAHPGIVLEGESTVPVRRLVDHQASWAQYFADSPVPGVLRSHWFERRHMQHHTRRWHRDHSEELQSAWLNGTGIMIWEVVFGAWVGWSLRDARTAARMSTIQRSVDALLLAGEWTPLASLHPGLDGVYASTFANEGVTLWALVNRTCTDYRGPVLPAEAVGVVIDLTGEPQKESDVASASVVVPARGIAAVIQIAPGVEPPTWLHKLRQEMAGLPHVDDERFPHRIFRRSPSPEPETVVPEAAVVVVPAGHWAVTVRYRARETPFYQGAPWVDEWKPLPPRLHDARTIQRDGVQTQPIAVALTEVTNAEFLAFIEATGYRPRIGHRYLAHWVDGRPKPGQENEPVVFVDLNDARAYCGWQRGRLPSEDEWQLAAGQGVERLRPMVWNWTESEHCDGRTRWAILKGGSDYEATGSPWYLDGGPQPPEVSVVLLLPGLGLARSERIGFRCAWVLKENAE